MAVMIPKTSLEDLLGWAATFCFTVLLVPQILLNHKRRSTEGLSLWLVLLWHLSALLLLPYQVHLHEPVALQMQFALFLLASIIIELQFSLYHPSAPPASLLLMLIPCLALIYVLSNAGIFFALLQLFDFLDTTSCRWLIEGIGSVGGSIALSLGFVPQLHVMFQTRSSSGFSLGVCLFDITGSVLSVGALFVQDGLSVAIAEVLPYAAIVFLQLTVLGVAIFLFPDPGRSLVPELCGRRSPTASPSLSSKSPTVTGVQMEERQEPPTADPDADLRLPAAWAPLDTDKPRIVVTSPKSRYRMKRGVDLVIVVDDEGKDAEAPAS